MATRHIKTVLGLLADGKVAAVGRCKWSEL